MRTLEKPSACMAALPFTLPGEAAGAMRPRHPTLDALDYVRSDDLARSKERMARIAPSLK